MPKQWIPAVELGVRDAMERGPLGFPVVDVGVLLEPIEKLTIYAPSSATSRITSAITSRRGQILGFDSRDGWPGWDRIEVFLPQSERSDVIVELRSVTQGLGTFEAEFDHMAELTGRRADEVAREAKEARSAA